MNTEWSDAEYPPLESWRRALTARVLMLMLVSFVGVALSRAPCTASGPNRFSPGSSVSDGVLR